MKTLIFTFIGIFVASAGWAFEGANFYQDRLDRERLATLAPAESAASLEVDDPLAQKREEMRKVYNLIQDEVQHIFPLFVGALEGQGAGSRFTVQELQDICAEIKAKLTYSRSCLHAAKVAAGLSNEEVLELHNRRKKQRDIYLVRINSLDETKKVAGQ